MIALFTDFGWRGPYLGQMKAVLYAQAPGVPVVDLLVDAPACDPRVSAYLLEPFARELPEAAVVLAVVDPGVGTGSRLPVVIRADGRWFVGPDNGLFELVLRRAREVAAWEITWRPSRLSASFHGRELFAPVAARLARGEGLPEQRVTQGCRFGGWPDDLAQVLYVDHYGNAMTGLRASTVGAACQLEVAGVLLRRARTFGEVPVGEGFWYENSSGLVEIAVNQGRAVDALGLVPGTPVKVH